MNEAIRNEYKDWLLRIANDWCKDYGSYNRLLEYLYSREFYSLIPNDSNREADGTDLRFRFAEETAYTYRDVYLYLDGPCTVLELMMGLASRIEDHIMWNPDDGDQSRKWFYEMLQSMRISQLTDYSYDPQQAEEAVDIFLERQYSYYGVGGLFTVHHPKQDMRKVEIWYQMCWYLNELKDS